MGGRLIGPEVRVNPPPLQSLKFLNMQKHESLQTLVRTSSAVRVEDL